MCPQRMLLRFCFLSFLCIATDLNPIDIVHQYLLHHRRSKQKDFLPPALPVVTLSLRLPMPSKPAPAAGMGKAGRHHVRHTAGNRRDAFFQFTPRVHWRNWSYRTLSHNRLPAEDQASHAAVNHVFQKQLPNPGKHLSIDCNHRPFSCKVTLTPKTALMTMISGSQFCGRCHRSSLRPYGREYSRSRFQVRHSFRG